MAIAGSRLQAEIRQTKPFRSAGQEAFLGILRTADVLRRAATRMLEPHGVTLQQYNVLRILRGAGEAGLPTLAIGERLIEEAPGITRLLDRMEARGWVRRERRPGDRRQVICRSTRSGLELLARLDPLTGATNKSATAALSKRELERLIGFLDRIREKQSQQGDSTQ